MPKKPRAIKAKKKPLKDLAIISGIIVLVSVIVYLLNT
jgi:hypothetical protein